MGGEIINPTEKSKCKLFPVEISNVKVIEILKNMVRLKILE